MTRHRHSPPSATSRRRRPNSTGARRSHRLAAPPTHPSSDNARLQPRHPKTRTAWPARSPVEATTAKASCGQAPARRSPLLRGAMSHIQGAAEAEAEAAVLDTALRPLGQLRRRQQQSARPTNARPRLRRVPTRAYPSFTLRMPTHPGATPAETPLTRQPAQRRQRPKHRRRPGRRNRSSSWRPRRRSRSQRRQCWRRARNCRCFAGACATPRVPERHG